MKGWEDPKTRLKILGSALALIVVALFIISVYWRQSDEEIISSRVDALITAFEDGKVDPIGWHFDRLFTVSIDGNMDTLSRQVVVPRAYAFLQGRSYVNVRKESEEVVILEDGDEAVMDLHFHVTTGTSMYPRGRFRTEKLTGGEPLHARIDFRNEEDQWLITNVVIETGFDSPPEF